MTNSTSSTKLYISSENLIFFYNKKLFASQKNRKRKKQRGTCVYSSSPSKFFLVFTVIMFVVGVDRLDSLPASGAVENDTADVVARAYQLHDN